TTLMSAPSGPLFCTASRIRQKRTALKRPPDVSAKDGAQAGTADLDSPCTLVPVIASSSPTRPRLYIVLSSVSVGSTALASTISSPSCGCTVTPPQSTVIEGVLGFFATTRP